jgi:hypothetical protein
MWYGTTYRFEDGSSVLPVPTYHFPGSMGFLFRFADGKTLFYSGDLNVKAAYLSERVYGLGQEGGFDVGLEQVDIGIIEAAFVGRDIGRADDSPGSIIDAVGRSVASGRHVLLLTPPSDYGLYLFLHLYDHIVSKSRRTIDARLFLDPLILRQIALIEWRMRRKQVGSLDDACRSWLASRVSLGESVRVFDASVGLEMNVNELARRGLKGVFILDDRHAMTGDYLPEGVSEALERDGMDIMRVGKAATVASAAESPDAEAGFGASPWLLHSSEPELAAYLLAGPQRFDKVYLFHNFQRRLQRFAARLKERGFRGSVVPL